MAKTVLQAYQDLEETWLSFSLGCRVIAGGALFVSALYPVLFLITGRWISITGFLVGLGGAIIFYILHRAAAKQAWYAREKQIAHLA